jgi:hypothetical protein
MLGKGIVGEGEIVWRRRRGAVGGERRAGLLAYPYSSNIQETALLAISSQVLFS